MTTHIELTMNYGRQELRIRAPYFLLVATLRQFAEDYFHDLPRYYYLNHAMFGSLPSFYRLAELFPQSTELYLDISEEEHRFEVRNVSRQYISFIDTGLATDRNASELRDIVYPFIDIKLPEFWKCGYYYQKPPIKFKSVNRASQAKLDVYDQDFCYLSVHYRIFCIPAVFTVEYLCVALDAPNISCGIQFNGFRVAGAVYLKQIPEIWQTTKNSALAVSFYPDFETAVESEYFRVDVAYIGEIYGFTHDSLLHYYKMMLQSAKYRALCKYAFYDTQRTIPDYTNDLALLDDYYNVIIKSFTFDPGFSLFLGGGQIEANTDPNRYRRTYFPDLLYRIDDEYEKRKRDSFNAVRIKAPELPIKTARVKRSSGTRLTSNQIFDQIGGNFFIISIYLVNGAHALSQEMYSSFYHTGTFVDGAFFELEFGQRFIFPIKYCDLPSGTQLCMTLWLLDKTFLENCKLTREDITLLDKLMYYNGASAPLDALSREISSRFQSGDDIATYLTAGLVPIGAVIQDIFDYQGRIICGNQQLSMYPDVTYYYLATFCIYQQNIIRSSSNKLTYFVPISSTFKLQDDDSFSEQVETVDAVTIKKLVRKYVNNPLSELTNQDYEDLYSNRYAVLYEPSLLPVVLKAIPIHKNEHYKQYHFIVRRMKDIAFKAETILELLDYEYPDAFLRKIAVEKLKQLSVSELALFIPYLTYVLKFEKTSDLQKYLLYTAIQNYDSFGWQFFWSVRSYMRHSFGYYHEYYRILLEFLKAIEQKQCQDLLLAEQVSEFLLYVAQNVTVMKDGTSGNKMDVCLQYMKQQMQNLNVYLYQYNIDHFKTPLSNAIHCKAICVEKCKIMDSKKAPLMLFLEKSADCKDSKESDFAIMAKNGDDLRYDALTIQILKVFDVAWKRAGLPTILHPYEVVSTGPDQGFIEIVRDAETLAKITAQHGATGAFKKTPILYWLDKQKSYYNTMVYICDRFYKSTAAYCVATYILGIADRHNDNVMLTRSGEFFHIDFGHFLGNFKKKFGIQREKAPFFFTPDLKFVMEQCDLDLKMNSYQSFIQLCYLAYNEARKQGVLLIVMMKMMCNTGIAELSNVGDLEWLIETLLLNSSDEEASIDFEKSIKEAVNSIATQFNNYCHLIAH